MTGVQSRLLCIALNIRCTSADDFMGVWLRIFFKNYLKASPHVRKKLLPILLISIRRCLARGRGGVPPPLRRFAAMAVPVTSITSTPSQRRVFLVSYRPLAHLLRLAFVLRAHGSTLLKRTRFRSLLQPARAREHRSGARASRERERESTRV